MKNTGINSLRVASFCKKTVILLLAVCLFCVVAPHRAEATCDVDPDGTYIEAENYT